MSLGMRLVPYLTSAWMGYSRFESYYIRGEHYFDVQPPLAKMLVGLSGILGGYDGSFNFESGTSYPDINYRFMRLFNATFGVVMSVYFVGFHAPVFDFFCGPVLTKFRNLRDRPFSAKWWMWLSLMGVGIGAVSSMKWVGLFVTALVGLDLLGDLHLSMTAYVMHWVARSIFLIALPSSIYVACFVAHFRILTNSGPDDAYMNSLFQANLNGTDFSKSPLEVAYGSMVTIKSSSHGGGLLHSHIQTYPHSSRQQQVATYHHKDSNNQWIIVRPHALQKPLGPDLWPNNYNGEIRILKNGDIVRLVHEFTGRNLHTHRIRAPVTGTKLEVSEYGYWNQGDVMNEWVLEVVGEDSKLPQDGVLRLLTTKFALRHRVFGCLLTAGKMPLPKWGFKQGEVFCDQSSKTSNKDSVWNIEHYRNDRLPQPAPRQYKPNFWQDFIHINVAMLNYNNGLVQDPDKNDYLALQPNQWPFLAVGIRLIKWWDNGIKIYLIGNPAVWWSGSFSLGVFVLTLAYYTVLRSRQQQQEQQQELDNDTSYKHQPTQIHVITINNTTLMTPQEWDHFTFTGKVTLGGWFLHYLPSLVMGRVMYLHHCLPPLYFTILLCAYLIDHFLRRSKSRPLVKTLVWGVAYAVVTTTFIFFWPASYGISGPAGDTVRNQQWRAAWDIVNPYKPRTFM
ncbi:Protein O-mannosyltransferase 2 [Mortierella sp. 14UC]|nr:Protein O-mannosyltransferase 2 [Mortierella sp. 14UC]